MSKRVLLDTENALFRRMHPVLLDVFCRGALEAEAKSLVLGAFLSLVSSPLRWVVTLGKKIVHLVILLGAWWLLKAEVEKLGALGNLIVALAILVVFYKELYREILVMLLHVAILISGGGFLRWICSGYVAGAPFRQQSLMLAPMEEVVASMAAVVPIPYRDQYDELMDLYLDSNEPSSEGALHRKLDAYADVASMGTGNIGNDNGDS